MEWGELECFSIQRRKIETKVHSQSLVRTTVKPKEKYIHKVQLEQQRGAWDDRFQLSSEIRS